MDNEKIYNIKKKYKKCLKNIDENINESIVKKQKNTIKILLKNNILKSLNTFFKKLKKRKILFINGKFGTGKNNFAQIIKENSPSNVKIINFIDIINKYCSLENIEINKIMFLFFTFDCESSLFRKISNSFIDFMSNYINNVFEKRKFIVIKGYLFNKFIFLKLNYLFKIYNVFLVNNDKEKTNKYFYNVIKKLYFDIKKNPSSMIIHKYFFNKSKFNSQELLQIIKTNNIDKNDDIYYYIENYIDGSSKNEHNFLDFYKNNFTKHNSVITI
jgi:hypothetical protein